MPEVVTRAGPPHLYFKSLDTTDSVTYVIQPDLSAVRGWDIKYWEVSGDTVTLADQATRDAIDIAEALTILTGLQATSVADVDDTLGVIGFELRALIELFNKRDNYLTNRIEELQIDMQAMKATTGNAQNMRDVIRSSYLATSTRPRSEAITDYKDIINNGEVDM